jgi:NADP-dependent 3-hydroxy acid dehydrogenase YdfG
MDKLAVITGASSGVGLATAKLFSEKGINTLLLSNIMVKSGVKLKNSLSLDVDVTDYEGLKDAIKQGEDMFGPVDFLFNNASRSGYKDEDMNEKGMEATLLTNIKGVMNGTNIVSEGMKKRRSGTIINVGSLSGIYGYPEFPMTIDNATKAAVIMYTREQRKILAPFQVRCSLLIPGLMNTTSLHAALKNDEKVIANFLKEHEGAILVPEEVAQIVYHIYSLPQHICIREIQASGTGQSEP